MEQFWQNLQLIILLGCVLPGIVLAVLTVLIFWFGRRWVANFVEPDAEKMQQRLQAMQAKNPRAQRNDLVRQVMREEAFKCGIVGAVTGFGGFVTLPITLPIDLLLTARYQASMVSFIAQAYGYEKSLENRAATYAVMTGSTQVSRTTLSLIRRYLPRIVAESFAKFIPVLGALISFVVNYALARSLGNVAVRWYEHKPRQEILAEAT
ncbi:MAG: hypothetical protein KC496_22010 [Anaerolineae bacterium]|nr:hypothetical protein [Anaerolineae bacterium]